MTEQEMQEKFSRIAGHLNEQTKRLWCASNSRSIFLRLYEGILRRVFREHFD